MNNTLYEQVLAGVKGKEVLKESTAFDLAQLEKTLKQAAKNKEHADADGALERFSDEKWAAFGEYDVNTFQGLEDASTKDAKVLLSFGKTLLNIKIMPRQMDKYLAGITEELKHQGDPDSNFDAKQLAMGIEMEKEHTDDVEVATAIAKAHLAEIPDYYTRLKAMEKEAGVTESKLYEQVLAGVRSKSLIEADLVTEGVIDTLKGIGEKLTGSLQALYEKHPKKMMAAMALFCALVVKTVQDVRLKQWVDTLDKGDFSGQTEEDKKFIQATLKGVAEIAKFENRAKIPAGHPEVQKYVGLLGRLQPSGEFRAMFLAITKNPQAVVDAVSDFKHGSRTVKATDYSPAEPIKSLAS